MKKLVLVLAILLVLPAAAFGIQYDTMNDSSMNEVTGQAGVSIAMDDVQLFMNIERIAWLDCDGYECDSFTNNGGAVGIGNFQLDVLHVNAIANTVSIDTSVAGREGVWDLGSPDCSEIPLQYTYADTSITENACYIAGTDLGTQTAGLNNYLSTETGNDTGEFQPEALTIDATSQLPILTTQMTNKEGTQYNMGGVRIGLPTIEIQIPNLTLTPKFYNVADEEAAENAAQNSDASFGTIELGEITMTVLSGWVEIAPH